MTDTPEQSTSWGSLLLGAVVGAVAGATVALLYAPKSGQETREELLGRLDEVKSRIDETAHMMAENTRTKLAETKADLTHAVEAGRTAARARAEELRRQTGME